MLFSLVPHVTGWIACVLAFSHVIVESKMRHKHIVWETNDMIYAVIFFFRSFFKMKNDQSSVPLTAEAAEVRWSSTRCSSVVALHL